MNKQADVVKAGAIAKGVLQILPDALTLNRGLWNMATLSRDRRGSIGLRVEQMARRYPQRKALMFDNRSWSYAEFNAWANRIAALLRAQGVRKGHSVALLMENRPEVLVCITAIVKLGAIAGMLNHNQRADVLMHSIKLTQAQVLIVGEECMEALQSTPCTPDRDRAMRFLWDGQGKPPAGFLGLRDAAADQPATNPPETQEVMQRDPCFYIFTSGTTGLPKASVMTHYRWLNSMAGVGLMSLRLRGDDVFYCPLPFYHNNALTVSWGAVLGAGATLAIGRKFSASRFWDEVRHYDATAFCYIGEILRYLLNRPASPRDRDHRVRVITGNGLRPEIWEEFQQRFGIARISEFYGASEGNLAFVNSFGLSRTAGFCPLTYAIVEFDADQDQPVRDAKGFLKKVAKGGVGLLISEVTDKRPFDGYTDSKASNSKLLRDVFKKGDCWFNTGDLVRDQGYRHIQFVDRTGDTFRWKGENVATTEVEGALNRYPGVEQAVVYGVQIAGADGRAGMAALTCAGGKFDGAALARHLCTELPAYAVPIFIRLREQQELTVTFKFRKVELKAEGFDPAKVGEPLYILIDRERGYEPLTPEIFARIQDGGLRL
ncbi:MAG TPA: long-chain-acyl-CoA synthetase [Stenotrophobium sp.]|nr:long-chain-acyl-CoA synthetase [Stenotrophobium sp.]